jgi:hypothetical protein
MCTFTSRKQLPVPLTVRAPWLARQFTRSVLCRHHADDAETGALLLVSELVTSAVATAPARVEVAIDCWETVVVLSIRAAAGSELPGHGEHGRLTEILLDQLTMSWGVEQTPEGGVVLWCMLPTASQQEGDLTGLLDDISGRVWQSS